MVKKLLRNNLFIFTCIILLGFAVRLYKINSPLLDWHSFRQADTASVSKYYFTNGINLLDPRYHDISRVQSGIFNPNGYRLVEFPIFNALHALFAHLLPFTFDTSGRLLSVIFSLITSLFIYKIMKYHFNDIVGKSAMLIYLILPYNVYFSRVILPEPFSVLLGISSLWFFIKYTQNLRISNLLSYAFLMSLAILVKPYVIFYNIYILYYFWRKDRWKKIFVSKDLLLIGAIVILPFVLWRIWILRHPEGIPFWNWTLNGDGVRFKPAFWYWIFGERIGKLILGVWGVFPLVYGIIKIKKNPFLLSLMLGAFLYLSVFATANVRHDYYQTLIVPIIAMLLAVGFWRMTLDFSKSIFGYFFPAFIFIIMLLISLFQVKEFYKINHPELIEAGQAVNRLTPNNALVIASYNGDTAFLYQTGRMGWPVVELPIDELISEGASYFVSINLNDSQTLEFMNRFQVIDKTNNYVILKLK